VGYHLSLWEYCAIHLGELPQGTNEVGLLNTAGKDGWELVAITPKKIAYLKRQFASPDRKVTATQETATHRLSLSSLPPH
jgi:hypothetical protein